MAIENVSDTARWVAVYRAMETARPDALFRDPFAERLAGSRGTEIVDGMKRGRALAYPMIVRTAVFDEMIMGRITSGAVDTVINLAAGLDTRPWRLPLPHDLRWYDVDLPAMTEYKSSAMQGETPVCRYESVAADLTHAQTRRAVLARLSAGARSILVVTEGLLVYLAPHDVADLATDLHDVPAVRWWLFDMASPKLLAMMNRYWGKSLSAGNAPFLFAPEEGPAFFEPSGWGVAEVRSGMGEARRLHRELSMMRIWRILGGLMTARQRESMRVLSQFGMLERLD
ncbi:MAG: SAM-dependent methyltransferase [Gemmatimonadota bacterium]|nr:SAM-dependent methyltransferase [Gemmatimonadota bacterium]